jgi:hypothetical protein
MTASGPSRHFAVTKKFARYRGWSETVMRANSLYVLTIGAVLVLLAGASELVRGMQPYNVETFGVFRNLMMTGDFSPKVRLDDAMAKHPTTGVGAVAGARGEITIFDGKFIVTYGKPNTPADLNASAALLAMGSVPEWQGVQVGRDVAPSEIESFIAATANAHGIDTQKSFPFQVRGFLFSYVMHVNAEAAPGPHGMGLPMAITVEHKGDDPIDALVSGLYVSPDLVGIATHGGERTHAHWVSLDKSLTAHLDRWGLQVGALLLLPKAQ